ncbi:hypothetical protein H0E87_000738 [Populus deltoides]|uniref:C2 domain-containing protein n=1 Tax=Populus deltoides TaxID=3696 RepID=A0A8T2ZNJ9_POPDE|nr:hypothetical protein H0E87_000738 [Populus deltoides]KAH8519016.1 hypothetical protein H0E87_000738 [Populus deltoides]KAH8519017.1 hypothetical protein H0E87_000738 [Populus deltoides]KAH8519018.1 hypothetical protein H0E87_000738 [Populus deltoides]
MDSPQSVVSPFKTSVVFEPEKQKSDCSVQSTGNLSKGIEFPRHEAVAGHPEDFIGIVEVYVHQARDIQNICIYHKQDVYAKFCLTSDPEYTFSTKIINGGGRNPVFNDRLQLNVKTIDSSLKCEIFMMSRVKNYLEDQLLGFALVPLSEVLINNGNLEKEFSLSSTDLFHSPAGFVQLSLSYVGASPEVMEIPAMPTASATNGTIQDSEIQESLPCELDKIEFPDPKVVNENQMMISEYFGISCSSLDSEASESLAISNAENNLGSEIGVHVMESISAATSDPTQVPKLDSPPSSVSTNGVSSPSAAASSETSDSPAASKTPNQEHVSVHKERESANAGDGETDCSGGASNEKNAKPVTTVNIEQESKVVQQDIVDMYMKSMQQFTESLAKMKLPLDIDSGPTSSGSSSSDQKMQASKNTSSRVFYGSRAFF